MLARTLNSNRVALQRICSRSIATTIVNPAKSMDPYLASSPVMPFGLDFVEPRLRAALEARGLDVDRVERLLFEQVRNDHEFNNPALPREDSPLWPYSYGEWLVKTRVRLDTLAPEEQYLTNYLTTLSNELENRMDTKYPSYDWRSVLAQSKEEVTRPINEAFEQCYADATADIIARDPAAFVAFYKNNAFIEQYDEDDKFKDHLPRDLENTLLQRYQFAWDQASPNADPTKYFDKMQKLDQAVSVPIDALTTELRTAFYTMLTNCFSMKRTKVLREFVDAINSATSVVKADVDGKRADVLVDEIFEILEISSASNLEGGFATYVAKLFFGSNSLPQISGQSVSTIKARAASLPVEDLALLREVLEIVQYLKTNSAARLVLAVASNMNPTLFGQLMVNEDAMNSFLEVTVPAMEEAANAQREVYSANKEVASALEALLNAVVSNAQLSDSSAFTQFVRGDGVRALASGVEYSQVCPVIAAFKQDAQEAQEQGLVDEEAYAAAQVAYLSNLQNVAQTWYALLAAYALNPPVGGFPEVAFYKLAQSIGTNNSDASSAFFSGVQKFLTSSGVDRAVVSGLQSSVSSEYNALMDACKKSVAAQEQRNEQIMKFQFDFDGKFNFDRVREKYNPFDIHLSQYNYLSVV